MAKTIYGVALSTRAERERLAESLNSPPYGEPPRTPVLYIKPWNCVRPGASTVEVPTGLNALHAAATMALLFDSEPNVVKAVALAVDVSEPHASYFRPAIRQRCRDGFLPLGRFVSAPPNLDAATITSEIEGVAANSWNLEDLVLAPRALIESLGSFMTLSDGDVVLVGLPDAPLPVQPGSRLKVRAEGLPDLEVGFEREAEE